VAEILAADSSVAFYPFFDHRCEPPLCYAIRHGCGIDVIRLLIEHGADVNAMDAKGATPTNLLRDVPYDASNRQLEQLLFAAGANDVMVTRDGMNNDQSDAEMHIGCISCLPNFDWAHPAHLQNALILLEDLWPLVSPSTSVEIKRSPSPQLFAPKV